MKEEEIIIGLDIVNTGTNKHKVWLAPQTTIIDFNKLADERGNEGKSTYIPRAKEVFIREGYS